MRIDGDTFIRDTVKLIEAFGEPVVAMTLFMIQMQIAADIAEINLYELQQEAAAWEKEMHHRRWGKN